MISRILLVDDHQIIRDGLKFYFETIEDYSIVAEACNGREALDQMKSQNFDLIISDMQMPEMDGLELMKYLSENNPTQKVLALTMIDEARYIKEMIRNGVQGYVLKDAGQAEVLKAVTEICNGGNYYSKEITTALIGDFRKDKPKKKVRLSLSTPLSEREKEVLRLIAEEYSNAEIADKLCISVRTVDAHKRRLLAKTGAKNVAGLVLYAIENELLNDIL